jgi:hypothetical protein
MSPRGPLVLAQDHTVVAAVPEDTAGYYSFFLSDAFASLGGGMLLAAAPVVQTGPGVVAPDGTRVCLVLVSRSRDRGATWEAVSRLTFTRRVEVALLAHGRSVYLLMVPHGKDGVLQVAASEDQGTTWSEPVEVIRRTGPRPAGSRAGPDTKGDWALAVEASSEQERWFCAHQTAMAEVDGRLYFALSERCQTLGVAVCDLKQGVMNPRAWRVSEQVEMPIPAELTRNLFPGPAMRCLEGNVIRVKNRLRVLARAVIDRYGTSGMAAVFDLEDDGVTPLLTFSQLHPLPGGQGKFFIVYDDVSRLYWMASNLPVNTQGWVESPAKLPLGNDRRLLMLWYACDALNWFPAGCIAYTTRLTEAFMYPSLVIDGDDLAILSRTSKRYEGLQAENRAKNGFHDANFLTFHRVKDFRALALDIFPRP